VNRTSGVAQGRIFMSYRREDTAYPAGWLFDRLASHFGRGQVFKDIDSIELGDDFVEVITSAVTSCDVLLALIGNEWLTIRDQDERRRLDNPGDFVRLEIEAALTRNVRVIPILVEGARMPRPEELPPSMAKLARRQALELSPSRFDSDTQRLLRVLDRAIAEAQEQARASTTSQTPPVPRTAQPPAHDARLSSPAPSPVAVAPMPARATTTPRLGPLRGFLSVLWSLLPVLSFGIATPILAPVPFAHAAIRFREDRTSLWTYAAIYGFGSLAIWTLFDVSLVVKGLSGIHDISFIPLLGIGVVASVHAFKLRRRVFAPRSPHDMATPKPSSASQPL
jgi:hypothetical protein